MTKYTKDTTQLMVKLVQRDTEKILLEIPSTPSEVHDFFNTNYVNMMLKSSFGDKLNQVGDVIIIVDQTYIAN